MNNWQEYSETISIEAFESKVLPDAYPRFFTSGEIKAYAHKRKKGSLAARYLIKKTIRSHFEKQIDYTDIEILNADSGKPRLYIADFSEEQLDKIHISLSHSRTEAAAYIIFEK